MGSISPRGPVLIIGGGIGGLSAALEFSSRNISCHLFEKSNEFSEIGAGLQLSPNAVRRLQALGLGSSLLEHAFAPSSIVISDGASLKKLNQIPLGEFALARYGAPYLVMMRSDLLLVLLDALNDRSGVQLSLGKKFSSFIEDQLSVSARMADGSTYEGAILVGADGIRSKVRSQIAPDVAPAHTGFIARRALIQSGLDQHRFFEHSETRVYLGRDAHLVHYPVRCGSAINLVLVTRGSPSLHTWDGDVSLDDLEGSLGPFHVQLKEAVLGVKSWRSWSLFEVPAFRPWHSTRSVLIGDAAHAVVPFLAQGAAQAIEDAASLGSMFGENSLNFGGALRSFQEERYKRTTRIQKKSLNMASIYHMGGFARTARNFGLGLIPSTALASQYDWIYKY